MAVALAGQAAAQNARIVLRWKDVPGASAYELQIARDPAFVEVVLQTRTTTAGYRWEQLPTTTHWWRVRSFDAEARPSEWSQPRTLAVDSAVPTPKRPADAAALPCGASVAFELEPSPLVKEYLVELSSSAEFSGVRTLRSPGPTLELPGLPPGTWWWRTRAVDIKSRTSGPGPTRSFSIRVAAPRPRPVGDVPLGTPQVTLSWGAVGCAKSYLVEATVDGKDRVSIPAAGAATVFKAGVAGEYRWRVASVDERGTPGEFSGESTFRVRLATPQPKPETVSATAQLAWGPVPTAASYRVELTRLGAKAQSPVLSPWVPATAWKSAELSPGRYQWRVTARDAAGHASAPSEFRAFEVAGEVALAPPRLAAPSGDVTVAVGTELDLLWTAVPEATQYEVELDELVLAPVSTGALRTPPLGEGAHRVRVRALAPPYRFSPWSQAQAFYAGVRPVLRAEARVEGDTVQVRLLDARGWPVAGATPRLSVRAGQLGVPELRDGWWQASWRSPPSGADVLTVEARDFRVELPLAGGLHRPFSLAVRAGGLFNGGAVASATGQLAFTARLPWLRRHLGGELRVALFGASGGFDVGGVRVAGQAVLLPLSLLLAWHQDVGALQLKLGAGPAVALGWLTVAGQQALRAAPGAEFAVALSGRMGPGRVELEVSYLHARFDTPLALFNGGGVGARLGYALDFGGGP